jgi:hypothetical protein
MNQKLVNKSSARVQSFSRSVTVSALSQLKRLFGKKQKREIKHCEQCGRKLSEWFVKQEGIDLRLRMYCYGGCGAVSRHYNHSESQPVKS